MSAEDNGIAVPFPQEVLTLDAGVTSYLSADELQRLEREALVSLADQGTPVGTPKGPSGQGTPVGTPKGPSGQGTPVGTPKGPTGQGTPVGTPKGPSGQGTPVGTPKG